MLSSVFSAFSFLPFDKVFPTKEQYAAFCHKLDEDTTLKDSQAHEKQLGYLKTWIKRSEHAHVE